MVVNPNNIDHVINLIPRYIPTGEISLVIDGTDTIDVTYSVDTKDNLNLSFTYGFTDETSYSVLINDSVTNEELFRGLILATTQVTQEYKLTNFKYIW